MVGSRSVTPWSKPPQCLFLRLGLPLKLCGVFFQESRQLNTEAHFVGPIPIKRHTRKEKSPKRAEVVSRLCGVRVSRKSEDLAGCTILAIMLTHEYHAPG